MKYKEPKIAAPLPFDGKRENTESFLNLCSLYISAHPSEFPTEDSKMHWVMSYMQNGSARLWRDYIMAQVRKGVKQFLSINDLINEIDVRSTLFPVPNPQEHKIKVMILNVTLWKHSGIPREQNRELTTT